MSYLARFIDGLNASVHTLCNVEYENASGRCLLHHLDDVSTVTRDVTSAVGLQHGPLDRRLQERLYSLSGDRGKDAQQPHVPIQFSEHVKFGKCQWTENISEINWKCKKIVIVKYS